MKKFIAAVVLGMVFSVAGAASADPILTPILSVDFQNIASGNLSHGIAPTTEAGFDAFNLSDGNTTNAANTYSGITVTLNGVSQGRNRNITSASTPSVVTNGGTANDADLLVDLASNFAYHTNSGAILVISGLTAGATYQIQLWSVDATNNNGPVDIYTWYDRTAYGLATTSGVGTNLGTITNASPKATTTSPLVLTDNNEFSITALVTADSSGNLYFGQNDAASGGGGSLNGLQLSALSSSSVPEPASLGLLAIGAVFGLKRRRRR